jgi:adenylate cyclase class 2
MKLLMVKKNREIEAKFFLPELLTIRDHLLSSGATSSSERVFEQNWRFDTADRKFEKSGEVLRVRVDTSNFLTYKRPTDTPEDRVEIDLEVVDGENATNILLALGYEVVSMYEKYREIFVFQESFVFLDELPFGNFVEVEGDSIETIQRTSTELGLIWEKRVPKNYLQIFFELVENLSLTFTDATFANFESISPISPEDLKLQSALE